MVDQCQKIQQKLIELCIVNFKTQFLTQSNLTMISFLQGIQEPIQKKLICGILRNSSPTKHFPIDIVSIIIDYYNEEATWKIPMHQIISKLNEDLTTIDGPQLIITDYKFTLKLKRSRNNLYFGAWYQSNHIIEKSLHNYFNSTFDSQTANKIDIPWIDKYRNN